MSLPVSKYRFKCHHVHPHDNLQAASGEPIADDSRDEVESSNELAKSRLVELEALQKANVLLAGEYEKLKIQVC